MGTIRDGYRNLVANLGTARDKASYGGYFVTPMSSQELLDTYRSAWLPKAIVDIPALDAVRKWRSWQADPDQITAIEAEEKRLNLREQVRSAHIGARLFGGSALLIVTGDMDQAKPLKPETIRRGGLKKLVVLTPQVLTPGPIDRDVISDSYGRPEYYTLSSGTNLLQIHPSRLAVFEGAPIPDAGMAVTGWADSVLLAGMEAIKAADSVTANVASLIFEAKIDVIHIPRLMEMLADGQEAQITERLMLAMRAKGINGTLILDGGGEGKEAETYEQKNANFATLPDLMDRFMLNVSGAFRIPVTRLFGRSAAGLSGSGDGDERVYFDHIQSLQELEMQPAMATLDECLIRSSLGARPAEIWYRWNPLRQDTAKERADTFSVIASAARTIAGPNEPLMPLDALSDALVNRLIEDGSLPGLESAIELYGSLAEQELDDVRGAFNAPIIAKDSAPRTLYVRRNVLNGAELIRWARAQGFKTTLPASDMHVTIAFSRTPVDWMATGESWGAKIEVPAGGARQMDRFGAASVLLFANSDLQWRHDRIKEVGASWDHPQYQPHVTISYDPDAPDVADIEPYQGPIILGPEIFEEVNEDWSEGIKEE